ncbi:MAG: VOC family protein [Burkholderiaceae bacterium]
MKTQIDHLVVVAKTLNQGVQWCEATFGITPGPGGEHAQFGTHNRLFKIATPANPLAYLEIIAIDGGVARPPKAPRKRWFDMDDDAVRAAVAIEPRLVHFVASTSDVQAGRAALSALDIDRGPAVQASRHSRRGLLQWQITVREDGQRLFDGALPTLIQWGKADDADPLRLHPRNSLPRSGVSLQTIAVTHPSADKLRLAYEAIGLTGVVINSGPANIRATFQSPRGVVELNSQGV